MSDWRELELVETRGAIYSTRIARAQGRRRGSAVLLHGFAGSSADWTDAAVALAAEGFDALGIDLPGHGGTTIPAVRSAWSVSDLLRDLVEVTSALDFAPSHWIGYSMGGRTALHVALAHSSVATSLVLESTSPGIASDTERAARQSEDEALAATIEARGIDWFVSHWEAIPIFDSQRQLSSAVLAAQRERRRANQPGGLVASLRHMGQGAMMPVGHRLAEVACPALLIAGALDPKYQTHAAQMAAAIPGAEARTIPGAGHNVHLEQPEAFQRAVLDHLDRVVAAGETHASLPS
ncbi:MAG: 2-succinyl-6-hydroxy-2,4-cyclohexadiene-1-carboxylate synthase [Candidatus Eiseniibacteriota bacterium]